jgi:RNA polymerase sigma-70 factor (family 1)
LLFRSGNTALAEDLVQDTFVKLYNKQIEYDKQKIKSLLYTIANGLFIDYVRRENLQKKYQDYHRFEHVNKVNNPEKELEHKELEEKINRALQLLGENERVVFMMSRFEELTYKEIAARLDLSVKAIEARMSKALKILRIELKDEK